MKRPNPFRLMLQAFQGGDTWIQGELEMGFYNQAGQYVTGRCLVGCYNYVAMHGLNGAAGNSMRDYDFKILEQRVLPEVAPHIPNLDAVGFNDLESTDWPLVEQTLEKAAIIWDEERGLV